MRTLRRKGVLARLTAVSGLLVHGAASPRVASAADLPGARLQLTRSPDAEVCVTEPVLAQELASRMTATGDGGQGPIFLGVDIRRDQDAYQATIRVEGRKEGVRSLRATGPSCDALHDALVVTLLLLLDEDPSRPLAPPASAQTSQSGPPTSAETPVAPRPPAGTPAAPRPSAAISVLSATPAAVRERPTLWISLGGALSHGLPQGWSVAAMGDVTVELQRWELGAGAFWAPERTIESAPGAVLVRVFGGRLRGCYALFERASSLRLAGCALGAVGSLRGEGQGFTRTGSEVRPWFLGGVGADLELDLSSRVRLGIFGAALASAHTESFSVRDLAVPYQTDRFVGWLGSDVRVRIW